MRLLDTIHQDARHAIRILSQNPGFAAVAILSLALGIGANTAIFTLIDTVLLRSLPVHDPERLVLFALNPDEPSAFFDYPDYEYIRDHNKSFSGVIAYGGSGSPAAMEVPDEGAHATAQLVMPNLVSGNYFEVLGVTPAVGRLLRPSDNKTEDAHPWAVLDYDFWQRRFGGDPRAVGRCDHAERLAIHGCRRSAGGIYRRHRWQSPGRVLADHDAARSAARRLPVEQSPLLVAQCNGSIETRGNDASGDAGDGSVVETDPQE